VATAAELPPGSVEHVAPNVGPSDLAAGLRSLVTDRARREAMSAAARSAAAGWTFDHLAAALVPTLEALALAAPGAVLGPGGLPLC